MGRFLYNATTNWNAFESTGRDWGIPLLSLDCLNPDCGSIKSLRNISKYSLFDAVSDARRLLIPKVREVYKYS